MSKMKEHKLGIVAHTWKAKAERHHKFETNQVYTVNSRSVRATWCETLSQINRVK